MRGTLFSRKTPKIGPAEVDEQIDLGNTLVLSRMLRIDDYLVITGSLPSGASLVSSCDSVCVPASISIFDGTMDAAGRDNPTFSGLARFVAIFGKDQWPTSLAASTDATPAALPSDLLSVAAANLKEIDQFLTENQDRLGFILKSARASEQLLSAIARRLPTPPATFNAAIGFIEQAKGIADAGGLVLGWTVSARPIELFLIGSQGSIVGLSAAGRWHRPDIAEAFSNTYGNGTMNAGFIQGWHSPLSIGDRLQLAVIDGEKAYSIAKAEWTAAPLDPASFARWAFELPIVSSNFGLAMETHLGPLLAKLITTKAQTDLETKHVVSDFGKPPISPVCSIIIPLYGRHDFMLNQLLEFTLDSFIASSCELIYIVDDPRILTDVLKQASWLSEANDISFRVVDGIVNRGFSGANNLGAQIARGKYLLLLNSDVIPIESGWVEKMMDGLSNTQKCGLMGARLLHADRSLQHAGMEFVWSQRFGAYLNKHPGAGMEPPLVQDEMAVCSAVTGACLLISRQEYLAVDGMHTGYLIGDFEDSDLCLKIRAKGLEIRCRQDVSLVHLERQSFNNIGSGAFREIVVRYNAWLHHKRWGDQITSYQKGLVPTS